MNKKIVLLCMLSFGSCFTYAENIKEAIEKSDVEQLTILNGSSVKLSAKDKDTYSRINQSLLTDINSSLKTVRFDRSDIMRLGLGSTGLATSLFLAYLIYDDGLACFSHEKINPIQLGGTLVLPVLAMPFAVVVAAREIYKGIKQHDRKQLRNRAQAVAALLKGVKTAE
jgi:hypothetical protein